MPPALRRKFAHQKGRMSAPSGVRDALKQLPVRIYRPNPYVAQSVSAAMSKMRAKCRRRLDGRR
jgi:hypothetical protein